jgi:signal transduction histidine kinase
VKASLPLRIFLVHLVFMVAIGAGAVAMVYRYFGEYQRAWVSSLRTTPAESLYSPLATEVARSLLLSLESGTPEAQDKASREVGESLNAILEAVTSLDSLVVVDLDGRIRYASRAPRGERVLASEDRAEWLSQETAARRKVRLPSGDEVTELLVPVFDEIDLGEAGVKRNRIGSVVLRYAPDLALDQRFEELQGSLQGGLNLPPAGDQLAPVVVEIARTILSVPGGGEKGEGDRVDRFKQRVSRGLDEILEALPIESLVIVDRDRRIQYISDPRYLDLTYTRDESASTFASPMPINRPITFPSGEQGRELMLPVWNPRETEEGGRERLGSVLVQYRPDEALADRLPELTVPQVEWERFLYPLIIFLTAAAGGGIVLAGLSGLPVRRLERALADFRARGFKGGLDPKQVGLRKELRSTVEAISELGGRLEALDARGREREALLGTLANTLEEGMVALGTHNEPVAWNSAALRILVGPPEQEAGATGDEMSKEQARRLQEAMGKNPDLRFATERLSAVSAREVEILRSDGSRIPANVTQVPFEIRPGETGALLLVRDLAALRKVEAHLLEAGRFAILAHLAAGLAHEIRNPLQSIEFNAAAVEEYVRSAGGRTRVREVSESVSTIRGETQRLTDLLNNYLGMVRPEKGAGPVDIRDLCRRVVQLVDYTARKSKVEIRIEGQENLPPVHGVPDRLQQAILNLALNAVQAMPEGGRLSFHTASSSGVVRLTVSDTGEGLPQELADELFDTRVTTKPGGTGLGLPLVRMIAEAHGGSVWYRSIPGQGASFTLVLPASGGAK